MTNLILPRRQIWISQPQLPAEIDRSQNIAHAWALNISAPRIAKDSAGNADGVFGAGSGGTTGNYWVIGRHGYELLFSNAGTATVDSTKLAIGNSSGSAAPSSTSWTFEADVTLGSVGGYQAIIGSDTGGAIEVRVNPTGYVELMKQTTALIGTSTVALSAGVKSKLAITYDGTNAAFYINGKPCGTATSTQTFTHGQYYLGWAPNAGEYLANDARLGRIIFTNRVLLPIEISSRHVNPWEIFKHSDSSLFVPASSGSEGQTLTPSLHSNSNSFYTQTVEQSGGTQTLVPNFFTNTQVQYVATISSTNTILPNLYSSSQVFYTQELLGSNSLVQSLYTNSNSFFTPLLQTSNTLSPVLISNASLFLDASLSTSNSLVSNLFGNTQVFYTSTVSVEGGPQQLTADRLENSQVFYSQLSSTGEVQVVASLYENSQLFYNPVLTSSIALTSVLFTNTNEVYEALVNLGEGPQVITPLLFSNSQSYFTQLVTTGQVILSPVILTNNSVFYHVVLSNGVITRFILRSPSSITTELSEVSQITTSINLISEIESGES